jgi:AcrR family transcriptional regulator
MIADEGLEGLSMQKLAKAAGVSPATIYIYFKDRDDLILKLYGILHEKIFNATMENFAPEMTFADGLTQQWINRRKNYIENPKEHLFIEHCRHSPIHDKALEIYGNPYAPVMKKFLTRAIENKELVPLPFEIYWSVAYGPLYQLLKFHTQGKSKNGKPFKLSDKMFMETLSLVIKALKP